VTDRELEILITPSRAQFEQLATDLKLLREAGAGSNTEAIVDAVRERAAKVRLRPVDDERAAA
jgi:hypothetical protein